MRVQFRQLATLRVTHAYNGGISPDLDYAIPAETAAALRRGRLLAKVTGGVLYLLYEADDAGQPIVSAAGATLRIGLRLDNPVFRNVTAPASLPPAPQIALWRNRTSPTALDALEARALVGAVFKHPLADTARPVTVSAEDDTGRVLCTETLTAAHGGSTFAFDLTGIAPGPITVREVYDVGPPRLARYVLHPELARENLLGIVELAIPAAFYASPPPPPAFEIAFAARTETLRYYLVVTNYTDADFDKLAVADAGFAEEPRTKIEFDKVPAGSFGPGDLSPTTLGGEATSKYVLFKSKVPIARQERARRKIQLTKAPDVLFEHLPQLRAEQSDSNLIIHVSKAK
jgi:hypothetical protein